MPNTLHVDYELMTYDESMKEIATKLRLSLFYDTDLMRAARKDYSLNQKIK